jgi:hypothetical protein
LTFQDYECTELARIFEYLCQQNHYVLTSHVRCRILIGLKWLRERRDEHFGNGRLVRNVFEEAIRRLANRIANVTPLTHELLTEFHPSDIELPRLPADFWSRHPIEAARFRTPCPGCGRERTLAGKLLGRRVRCSSCGQRFTVDWAEPLLEPTA